MPRFLLGFAALAVVACSRSPETSTSAPPEPVTGSATGAIPSAPGAKWPASASRAPAPMAKLALASQTSPAWPRLRADADAILDDAAAAPPTADGIKQAAAILKERGSKLRDPKWAGSGTAPWATWMHHAGLAILADLAQRACTKKDEAVVAAIDTIDLPPIFHSGGIDEAHVARDRNDLRRAASGCGATPKE